MRFAGLLHLKKTGDVARILSETPGVVSNRPVAGSQLVQGKPKGLWIDRVKGGGQREGCRLPTLGADALTDVGVGGGCLTSGALRKGGGVSERTLIRPLGHTR